MQKTLYTRQYQVLLALLRELRTAAAITQVQLAAKLDLQQSVVSKCEAGTRRLDLIELKIWVEALDVALGDFVQEFEARLRADAATGNASPQAARAASLQGVRSKVSKA